MFLNGLPTVCVILLKDGDECLIQREKKNLSGKFFFAVCVPRSLSRRVHIHLHEVLPARH